MAKQQAPHKYIFKISSARLRRAKWNLTLTLLDARKNDEVIALNDSQMLRWIDELNGVDNATERVMEIKSKIKAIKRAPQSLQNRREIKRLYSQLDNIQFVPDYLHLVIDKNSDYIRACKGFKVNGISYTRLLGTSGGVKNSTIVFVSERLAPELRKRINNGRNDLVEQIPAKLEAYRALTCSGSIPVSMPRGILVVPDCETTFKESVIMLNDEGVVEPVMEEIDDFEITLNASDGYGLMLPSLAARWSEELQLDYVASGMNTRFAWEKGMVFCFDFLAFADKVAGNHLVKDAWGNEVDITQVELILTTSMVKLWACYDSIEHYLQCCQENHYSFGIAKTCPKVLDEYRALNYQFIQSYNLTDEQIDELIEPTVSEIMDIVQGDYMKAILFLGGTNITEKNVLDQPGMNNICNALIANPKMYNDPFVRKTLYRLIENRINQAKIGVLDVHGNYSVVCGDPYALCQNIFGLEVTGLLKAGEIYNRYWVENGGGYVACFRAPMSCHNNIRKMRVVATDEMSNWYRYMNTCTILNAWDTTTQALNGCDFDGDLIFITDNRVLVDNIRPTKTVFCVQRKGVKCIPSEDDMIKANIASFGDDIGRTTNWITSMYDVQSQFAPDSAEYKELEYRIICGQLFQQNAIDKAKGILCKPMPRSWYDFHGNSLPESATDEEISRRQFNISILADKKPYFMRYIYPDLMKQYNTYIKNTNTKCGMLFRMSVSELLDIETDELTEDQKTFIKYYNSRMPVSVQPSVMNRICRRVEHLLSHKLKLKLSGCEFDPSILKSGEQYTTAQHFAIAQIYKQYRLTMQEYAKARNTVRVDEDEAGSLRRANELIRFTTECLSICSNSKQLCDILIDICYSHEGTKQFAWDVCGEDMLANLRQSNHQLVLFPINDDDGQMVFRGKRYSALLKECA